MHFKNVRDLTFGMSFLAFSKAYSSFAPLYGSDFSKNVQYFVGQESILDRNKLVHCFSLSNK